MVAYGLGWVNFFPALCVNYSPAMTDEMFVGNAQGFVRLNLAMPRAIIEKGLRRMSDAIHRHVAGSSIV